MLNDTKAEKFYSMSDLAVLFSVSSRTISRWKKCGKFPAVTNINGLERYSAKDVTEFIRQQNPKEHSHDMAHIKGQS